MINFIADVSPLIKEIELRSDPVVITVNKFDEESANEFASLISAAQNTGQRVVPVVIDSYGGEAYSLLSMIATLKSSKIPIATIIKGKAMSCGALFASFGEEGLRFMDKDAVLMIHDVSTMAFGKVEELKADAREAERLNKKLYTMMARNCGKADNYFLDLIHDKGHADWFLEAEEAKEHNIVQQLRVPSLKGKVTVAIELD
jgi:ATP-dependent Clp protease protease subunit